MYVDFTLCLLTWGVPGPLPLVGQQALGAQCHGGGTAQRPNAIPCVVGVVVPQLPAPIIHACVGSPHRPSGDRQKEVPRTRNHAVRRVQVHCAQAYHTNGIGGTSGRSDHLPIRWEDFAQDRRSLNVRAAAYPWFVFLFIVVIRYEQTRHVFRMLPSRH